MKVVRRYQRSTGDEGIFGTWAPVSVTSEGAAIRIDSAGENGIRFVRLGGQTEYTASFDGQQKPISTPAGKQSVSLRRVDERTFEATVKVDGKIMAVRTFQVSSDGKELTETAKPSLPTGPIVYVKE